MDRACYQALREKERFRFHALPAQYFADCPAAALAS